MYVGMYVGIYRPCRIFVGVETHLAAQLMHPKVINPESSVRVHVIYNLQVL